MEAFSPIGANVLPPSDAAYTPATPAGTDHYTRPTRPSTLRHSIAVDENEPLPLPLSAGGSTGKRTFPLIERLQSAIKSIEDRHSPVSRDTASFNSANVDTLAPSVPLAPVSHSSTQPTFQQSVPNTNATGYNSNTTSYNTNTTSYNSNSNSNPNTYNTNNSANTGTLQADDIKQIERIIERNQKHLHDQLQTDLHSLHMDMLKQCLAVQKHQEQLLQMYLPQVKELAEELRVLREENARLRARLSLN